MVKRKFEQEPDGALACDSLAHGDSEKILDKKQKLLIPAKIGASPIINRKLSRGENPEFIVGVMLDPGANVPVLLQSLVGEHKMPVVLWERPEIIARYDGAEGKGAGSALTFGCTLSLADHNTKESFVVFPLQDDPDILMPQW